MLCTHSAKTFNRTIKSFSSVDDFLTSKGKSDQQIYFHQKDKEMLRKLLDKNQWEVPVKEEMEKDEQKLREIFQAHEMKVGLNLDLLEDLIKWKRGFFILYEEGL